MVSTHCLPKPVVASIENVTLPNGALVRGISMAVGSTFQNISMFASADYNETYIYGTDGFCTKDYSSDACMSFRGGAYDTSSSSTQTLLRKRKTSDGFYAQWVQDTLNLSVNATLSRFGFGIPQQDLNQAFTSQSQLGLGRNSSFLQALQTAGHITTKAYSIFWGLVGGPASKQTPGSLIFGGLDKALIADPADNFTASLFYGSKCGTGMLVAISDILLNWPNGTDMSILMGSQSAAIQACISPSFAGLISLPLSYYQNFQLLAGGKYPGNGSEARSFGINYFTMLFDPSDVYYGGLTIKFQNSISVRIPNTELVVPDTYIASDGAIRSNYSVRNVVINSLQSSNDNDLPVLGRLFMSSCYLMVNQEAETFSIWQANTRSQNTELVALDKVNNLVGEFCTEGANATSIRPSATSSARSSTKAPKKLSGGAIGGIVVGSFLGIAILITIAYLLWQRREISVAATGMQKEPELKTAGAQSPTFVDNYQSTHNMIPSELSGNPGNIAELEGRDQTGSR